MPNDNAVNDFAEAMNLETERGQQTRDIPPLHPGEREKWVDLSKEEPLPGMPDHNIISLPKRKLKARYGRFNLADEEHVEKLEEIQTNCLSGKGWILAREEWNSDKEGNSFAIVKYLEPIDNPKSKVEGKKRTDDK